MLKISEGVAVSGTFPGYPHDKFKSPKGTLGNHLDHAFFKQYGAASYQVAYFSYLNAKKYNGNPEATETATCEADLLKPTVTEESSTTSTLTEDRNFPSDHLPVIVKLIIKRVTQ